MINPPLLSIVTITKNDPNGLARTKASIDAQSMRNFEWIVVDGNTEPDNGIYDAMNKGLSRATGDYILFLNGGDILADPEILSLVEQHIAAFPSDFIYGDAMEEINGKLMVKKSRPHTTMARGMFTHHQSMLYNRRRLNGLTYDASFNVAGDYDFTLRFLKQCKDISYIPAPLCQFASGGVSQTHARLGRNEEFISKIKNNPRGTFLYAGVYGVQTVSFSFRKNCPSLYFRLRDIAMLMASQIRRRSFPA